MDRLIPKKGDLVSYFFSDQSGHEQQGRRPALVISNNNFNELTGIAFVCPVTNADHGYPFHIPIPSGNKVSGVVMVDQLKAIDYRNRDLKFLGNAPTSLLRETLLMIGRIVN